MPRNGRRCSACDHPEAGEIAKFLAAGGSKADAAVRFGLTESAVQRHRVRHLRITSSKKPSATPIAPVESAGSVRFATDDPASLVKATARLVDEALDLLEHAKRGDDRRTALAALREARDGLSLLMRAAGLLAGDGLTVNVDARAQTVKLLSGLSTDELRRFLAGDKQLPGT